MIHLVQHWHCPSSGNGILKETNFGGVYFTILLAVKQLFVWRNYYKALFWAMVLKKQREGRMWEWVEGGTAHHIIIPSGKKRTNRKQKDSNQNSNGNIKRLYDIMSKTFREGVLLVQHSSGIYYLGISCCVSNQAKKKGTPENVERCAFLFLLTLALKIKKYEKKKILFTSALLL